jgi:hypothetical protein
MKGCGRRAQLKHGPNFYPLVTLSHTWMNTDYGGRERPQFKIWGYEPLARDPSITADQAPQLEAPQQPVEAVKPQIQPTGQAAPKPTVRDVLNTFGQDHAAKGSKQPPKEDDLNDEIVF